MQRCCRGKSLSDLKPTSLTTRVVIQTPRREIVVMSMAEDGTCELTKNETGSGFAFAALDFTPEKSHTGAFASREW